MVSKHLHVMAFFSLFLLFVGVNLASLHAQETQVSVAAAKDKSIAPTQVKDDAEQLRSQIDRIQETMALQEENADKKIQELKGIITSQRDVIDSLKVDLKSIVDKPLTNATTFEVWSGILLACVAVIVTVLGVAIAIISFVGGKTIIVASKQISQETATVEAQKAAKETASTIALEVSLKQARKVATKIANDVTLEVAERKLIDHLERGGFNTIIEEAVDKIALSNIVDPENYNEGDANE